MQHPITGTTSEPPSHDRLWRFIAYYGMSELAQRVTRLATTVLVARMLLPIELGLAATAITCFELVRVVANAGVGQAVIRASDAALAGTCLTAWRLMWAVCAGLALLQTVIGAGIAAWTGHTELFGMIAALAGVYLMMPPALIQTYLIQRTADHATIAKVATAQAVADNMLTIAMALAGCGAWSIVVPKLVTCPIWMLGMRSARPWTPDLTAAPEPARRLLQFTVPVLGAELLTAARLQLDKVLVGAMLGVEALGIYYFVFNAGIGLSLSLTGALSNALYPYFAAAASTPRDLLHRLDHSLARKALPIALVVFAQAALAPLYVPLLFGTRWTSSAWLVAVLCASAATKLFADAGAQALRAAGATRLELAAIFAITVLSLAALAVGLMHGLPTAVVALAFVSGSAQLTFAAIARQRIARLAANQTPPGRSAGMLTVTHLLDDGALGGVTRFLDALAVHLGPGVRQRREIVAPHNAIPPALTDDVVVVHFTMSWRKLPYLLALRMRRGTRPIVLVEHSYTAAFETANVTAPRRFHAMLRAAYTLVDRVVAVSYGQAAWIRRSRLVSAAKLTIISPFTDCGHLTQIPPPADHAGPLHLGAYGRYCTQKDFATLLAAMRTVDPATATLTLRGFGPDADDLQRQAGIIPNVTVGGPVDDLADFLASVDAIVVPSQFEPFGQVALEARLAARPVIVTDVDGLPEQIEPAAGLIVPAGDPPALATAISALAAWRHDGAWRQACQAARASASDHVDASTRSWRTLLIELQDPSATTRHRPRLSSAEHHPVREVAVFANHDANL